MARWFRPITPRLDDSSLIDEWKRVADTFATTQIDPGPPRSIKFPEMDERIPIPKDDWKTAQDLYDAACDVYKHFANEKGLLPDDLPAPLRRLCEIALAYDVANDNRLRVNAVTRRRLEQLEEELSDADD